MAEQTIADRIMDAAEGLAIAAVEDVRRGSRSSRLGLNASRAILAALVAEACAPPPERVCRWAYQRRSGNWGQGCTGDANLYPPSVFCPDCGGRIEATAWADEDIEAAGNG